MNYFTHDLYRKFNSSDLDEAVRADEEWEKAIVKYKEHLETFRDELPPGAKKLAEELNLHDAQLVESKFSLPLISALAPFQMLVLRSGEKLTVIIYSLWESIKSLQLPLLHERPVFWLYDEVERDPNLPRHFWHNILLSDGSTFNIPFVDCVFYSFVLNEEQKSSG